VAVWCSALRRQSSPIFTLGWVVLWSAYRQTGDRLL